MTKDITSAQHFTASRVVANVRCPHLRGEKKVLNDINLRAGEGALTHYLPDSADPTRRKKKVENDAEKVGIQQRSCSLVIFL